MISVFNTYRRYLQNKQEHIIGQYGSLRLRHIIQSNISMKLYDFSDEISTESPAPGGGSVSALAGALGASLSAMVANLTFGKNKWLSVYDKMYEISFHFQQDRAHVLKQCFG